VSWSWLVGAGVTAVRVGEVGAVGAGLAAVLIRLTTPRAGNVGVRCALAALVLVFGLNILEAAT
jgi:hypothetical protein